VPTPTLAETSRYTCELGVPVPENESVSPGEPVMIFVLCAYTPHEKNGKSIAHAINTVSDLTSRSVLVFIVNLSSSYKYAHNKKDKG
jgi:hypothetical protein